MEDFFMTHWSEIIMSLITAGSLGFCKYALGQIKNYKKLLEEKDESEITKLIKKELEPIKEEIQNLKESIAEIKNGHQKQLKAIIRVYRFRLVSLCKDYLEQGYITPAQFEQLSEFYKSYCDLGGNGQAKEYYDKTKDLPIKDDDDKEK